MNVLIVKLTSMGDLIHALPALTDAKNAIPSIRFDWVIDEAFVDVARMHPAVDNVIITAHRRWQRGKWKSFMNGEWSALWKKIRAKKYDAVIDAQNNLKSAFVTFFTRGTRYGMDRNSAREKFADLACNKTFDIPVNQHAITRQRQLFAKALNYPMPQTAPDFGIMVDKLPALPLVLPKPYITFLHSTTWDSKHWPESYWQELTKLSTSAGYHIVLPWGNATEEARAQRLAAVAPQQTIVLPRLSIPQQATMLLGASSVVCLDTGLGHLTSALNVPAVHLYGSTDPKLIGALGRHQEHLVAEYECVPCYLRECKFGPEPVCFLTTMRPEKVFKHLQKVMLDKKTDLT